MLTPSNLYVFQCRLSLPNQWHRLIGGLLFLQYKASCAKLLLNIILLSNSLLSSWKIMLFVLWTKVLKVAHSDPPRVTWEWSWRPDRCSRCSSCQFRSHSCHHSAWPADNEGRRRRWWPWAPLAGLQNSFGEYSCIAWHRQRDGSDQLDSQKEDRRE